MNEHFCNVGEKIQAEMPDYRLKYMEYMPQPNKSPDHDLKGSKVIKLSPVIFAYSPAKIYNWSEENGFIMLS